MVVLLFGLTSQLMAQDPIELEEVMIPSMNFKYLDAVDNSEAPMPVKVLEKEAAKFKAEGRDLYVDNYGTYEVSFYVPKGKLIALYDEEGNVLRTIERFKNVQLPEDVRIAVKSAYPGWEIVKDVYQVNYTVKTGAKKVYKMKLRKGNEVLRIKMDHKGNYL